MPSARAASAREAPSSTRAKASIRRAAAASRHRFASRRSSTAPSSCRVTATVMAPPPIGYTADQRPQAVRGAAALTVRSRGRWYKAGVKAVRDAEHRVLHRDPHGYCAHPHLVRCGGELLVVFNWSPRRAFVLHPPQEPLVHNLLICSADDGATWSAPVLVP